MEKFYTILTDIGRKKITNAYSERRPLELKEMAVGDGGGAYYNPDPGVTALRNQKYKRELNSISTDPDNPGYLVCEMIIPTDTGGFTVREAAVFDEAGDMIAVGKIPETYKPMLETGAAKDLYIRFVMEVSNTEAVTLKINPSVVLATKEMAEKAAAGAVTAHEGQVNPHNQYMMKEDYTAGDVLAKMLTADGAGSGLDADTLDGVELDTINAAINSRQAAGDYATNSALNSGLAGKAAAVHSHEASQVTFTDGQTFQQKLDNGSLKGPPGIQGPAGAVGPQGPKGDSAGNTPSSATWRNLTVTTTGEAASYYCRFSGDMHSDCPYGLDKFNPTEDCANIEYSGGMGCDNLEIMGGNIERWNTIPSGGTWAYVHGRAAGVAAGDTKISKSDAVPSFCWKIA